MNRKAIRWMLGMLWVTAWAAPAEPLKTGESIPEVTLRDRDGQPVNLRKQVARQTTVLVFYRGGWCPYCTRHLGELAGIREDLEAMEVQLLAISIDQPSRLRETAGGKELGYTLLSDADAEAAEAFGIAFTVPETLVSTYKSDYNIDLEAASGRTHHRLPHPSVFVVGRDGVVRFDHVNEDYKVRLDPAKILEAAREAARAP